jgi:hypothetical protein
MNKVMGLKLHVSPGNYSKGAKHLWEAVLILLTLLRRKDERHAVRRALAYEFEGEQIGDLTCAAVAASRKHVMPEQHVDERATGVLRRLATLRPEFAADSLELLLRIAVEQCIPTLISELFTRLLGVAMLQGI